MWSAVIAANPFKKKKQKKKRISKSGINLNKIIEHRTVFSSHPTVSLSDTCIWRGLNMQIVWNEIYNEKCECSIYTLSLFLHFDTQVLGFYRDAIA